MNFCKKIWVVITALVLVFTSCNKYDPSTSSVNPANPVNPVKVKLKKVHTIDGLDTSDEEYIYNADNLVTLRKDSFAQVYSSALQYFAVFSSYFFYNAGNDKPIKDSTSTKFFYAPNTTRLYSTITYYYYDTQNRLTKAESFVMGNLVYRKLYTYTSDKRIENYYKNNSSGPFDFYVDTISINSKSQINEIISHQSGGYDVIFKSHFSYDTSKNPYFDLNIIKYGTRGTDSAYFRAHIIGLNNCVQDSVYYQDGGNPYLLSSTRSNIYIYNSNGYPVSAYATETYFTLGPTPIINTVKISYEYY